MAGQTRHASGIYLDCARRSAGMGHEQKRQGENNIILETLTQNHGRHLGLVRGGASRKKRPMLQKGNLLQLTWRARLDEHLGMFQTEPISLRSAHLIENKYALYAIGLLCQMLCLLPERDPDKELYHIVNRLIDGLMHKHDEHGHGFDIEWLKAYALFELKFLEIMGFPLDLEKCAATGKQDELTYVSPKTGRAVCYQAGLPYQDKLLSLSPLFIFKKGSMHDMASSEDQFHSIIASALQLTGYFLNRNIFEPRAKIMPFERDKIMHFLAQCS